MPVYSYEDKYNIISCLLDLPYDEGTFRFVAELLGPKSRRRYVCVFLGAYFPRLMWLGRLLGPRPSKEQKALINEFLDIQRNFDEDSDEYHHLKLYCKARAELDGIKKIPKRNRHLAKW